VRRPTSQHGAPQHWLQRLAPVLRAFVGARPAKPCLRLLKEREKVQDTQKENQNRGILRYLPALGQGQSCLRGGPSGPGLRRHCRGLPTVGFGAAFTSGARGAEGVTCLGVVTTAEGPASCTAGAGTCSWGGMWFGLTPRSHPNHLGQGVKYPLGLPPLLGPGPWCPGPRH
jgi:hypothetical protein